jgi:hypothetical protein
MKGSKEIKRNKEEQREVKRNGEGVKRVEKERGDQRQLMRNGVQASKRDEEVQKGGEER